MLTGMLQLAEDHADGVDIRVLEPATTVIVETHHSRYRFVILVDRSVVLVKGGGMDPDHTVMRPVEATAGGSIVKVGWIVVGQRIEMRFGSVCIRSSPVRSVKVENKRPSIWHSSGADVIH